MTTNPSAPTRPGAITHRRLPTLTSVEGDAYVFVAALEDPAIDGPSNWLLQRLRVDPSAGDADELTVDVTERYHVDDRESRIAFEDRYTISVSADEVTRPARVGAVRRALERWYRRNYPVAPGEGPDTDTAADSP